MFTVGSCTVLYNPNESVLTNLNSYSNCVDVSVVVDNSDTKNEISQSLKNDPNFIYIDMDGNKGIAAALNKGIEYLNSKNIDFALTMDQDSLFPTKYYPNILKLVNKYKTDYSVIGLNFNQDNGGLDEIIEVPYWITSGNFVNISDFISVGGFMNELFIDYVDFELGYKFKKNGFKICYLKDFSLKHTIGNPIEIHLFGKTYYAMNHSPIRYYYRYRNAYYLYHFVDRQFFKKEYYKEMIVNTLKMLIYEKNQKVKFSMIRKGIQDAKCKKMGKFN
ncbi:glycosyltransferase [Holdemanella porci]|uniref:glycosyltransferase n=2 Tax=Holdemanella porci TaxID=2652276 RepID=UPI00294255BD|nr:glycosyltransferase [Holdemanella porci]